MHITLHFESSTTHDPSIKYQTKPKPFSLPRYQHQDISITHHQIWMFLQAIFQAYIVSDTF
jgi:hypothetical protein